ncbi:hypothetical protein ZIOFF_044919 [Zingiber officinale]|uniref:Beta-glucosidase n=1 Tax=Zingiber officinale TaxID=94328 RepID=A0A8J5KUU4_ZINOF|nr:hypothetical protein ZIOFF_044919 [Zingiber officinale]
MPSLWPTPLSFAWVDLKSHGGVRCEWCGDLKGPRLFLSMASSKVVNGGVKVAREVTRRDFPGGFVFGSATSAYQVMDLNSIFLRPFSLVLTRRLIPLPVYLLLLSESRTQFYVFVSPLIVFVLLVYSCDAEIAQSNGGSQLLSNQTTLIDMPRRIIPVEGARREGGKGDSIWDIFSGKKENIKDGCNGDIAVDQYHRFKEDVELMCILGFGAYRFSIAWTRIFPGTFSNIQVFSILADELGSKISEDGVAYYNSLIDFLLEKGIQPYATLYHWDLPNILHESIGGWLSENIVQYFALYAEVCFEKFGDRVKHWITINEPRQTAINGYGYGVFAPGRHQNSSVEPYLAAHYQLLAHAAAVSVYQKKFKDTQGGLIGLVVDCEWAEPFSDKLEDKLAAERWLDFQLGCDYTIMKYFWGLPIDVAITIFLSHSVDGKTTTANYMMYLDPIYHGEYPLSMRERVGDQLPKFSEADKELLRNSTDFIGLNHYTTKFVRHVENTGGLHFYRVQESHITGSDGEAVGARAASEWLYIVPWGLRKLLNYIAKRYHNPSIYITENGMDQEETETASLEELLDDQMRVDYYKTYLRAVADAIKDGVDVRGYFAWSFLDNFEWAEGYTKRFGMVYIDYKNGLTRYPKSSALWFSHFLKDSEEDCGKKVDQE